MKTLTTEELCSVVRRAVQDFKGEGTVLESAIGALFVGHAYGWRVMFLMHSRSTVRSYEKILSVKFQECLPEKTGLSKRSPAFRALEGITNFWKVVKGEITGVRSTRLDK